MSFRKNIFDVVDEILEVAVEKIKEGNCSILTNHIIDENIEVEVEIDNVNDIKHLFETVLKGSSIYNIYDMLNESSQLECFEQIDIEEFKKEIEN